MSQSIGASSIDWGMPERRIGNSFPDISITFFIFVPGLGASLDALRVLGGGGGGADKLVTEAAKSESDGSGNGGGGGGGEDDVVRIVAAVLTNSSSGVSSAAGKAAIDCRMVGDSKAVVLLLLLSTFAFFPNTAESAEDLDLNMLVDEGDVEIICGDIIG